MSLSDKELHDLSSKLIVESRGETKALKNAFKKYKKKLNKLENAIGTKNENETKPTPKKRNVKLTEKLHTC